MTKISTQFQLKISFQQFVVETTGCRGGSSITSQISKAWNGNMKSKKHVQSRSRALEDTHKSRNIQPQGQKMMGRPNSNLEFLFNNSWLRPLDVEEGASITSQNRRPSLGTETWSQKSAWSRGKSWNRIQRIWNDPSQATEAKELRGAKAAERLKTLTNPEIRGKDNGQSRKKQERTEYTLTR